MGEEKECVAALCCEDRNVCGFEGSRYTELRVWVHPPRGFRNNIIPGGKIPPAAGGGGYPNAQGGHLPPAGGRYSERGFAPRRGAFD